jgi:uncharacterized protein
MQTAIIQNARRNKWRRIGFQAALLVSLWLFASFAVAYRATRRPHRLFAEPPPAISWGEIQSVRLPTEDGEELGGWFVMGQVEKPAVVLLHGHRGCRGNCLSQAEVFAGAGCSVLLVSLRAHGDSTGEFNDIGYSSRHDVLAAVEWLEKRQPGRTMVIYGQSMGAAAATFAAAHLGNRVHGYILESPYQDLRTAVWNRMTANLPLGLDVLAYAGLSVTAPLVLPELDRISPLDAVAEIPRSVPVLLLAGEADRLARPEEARALADRIGSMARLVVLANGQHARLLQADPQRYRHVMLEFLGNVR